MATSLSVITPSVPNLPVATLAYSADYTNQINNVLRLYFNQINKTLGTLVNSTSDTLVPNNESPYALPPYMQVARGLVNGTSVVNIYGYQGSVGATFIPIWENATTYAYPSSATTMLLWSSSASDTAVKILINGLDTNYNAQSETLTLTNGTTGVTTTNSYLRINNISVVGTVNAVGTLNLGNAGKTVQYAEISAGSGKSQMMIYTVPNGYTFYLARANAYGQVAGGSNNFINYRVWTQSSAGIIQVLLQAPFVNEYQSLRIAPRAYASKTDIQWQCNANSSTATVGIGVEGILVANSAS